MDKIIDVAMNVVVVVSLVLFVVMVALAVVATIDEFRGWRKH